MDVSHSSNISWQNSIELTARLVLEAKLSLADMLFSRQPEIYKLYETQRGAGFTTCPVFHRSVCHADWKPLLPFEIYLDQEIFIPLTPRQ